MLFQQKVVGCRYMIMTIALDAFLRVLQVEPVSLQASQQQCIDWHLVRPHDQPLRDYH
jgi:hypothetical protein